MMYQLLGRSRIDPHARSRVVDRDIELDAMTRELRLMRRDHPLWDFWIELEPEDEEDYEEIRASICLQPVIQIEP
jgi:hypothetical protein